MTTYTNGLEFDANSRLMITDLGASAVPATAVVNAGWYFNQTDGSLYVTTSAFSGSNVARNGLAQRNDGAVYVSNSAPSNEVYVEGIACDSNGVMFIARSGTIDHYENGLPFTSTSRLVTN